MPSTTFTARVTRILATWLQEVNDVVFGLSAPSGSSLVGFIQGGTGAVATTVQDILRTFVTPQMFGGVGDGVADDKAAILAASVAAVAQKKAVLFVGTWNIGSQIVLTSAHTGLKWVLAGATIKKGFSGDLVANSGAQDFAIDGTGTIDGQHGTYTGKGFVFSTGNSDHPYFGAGILFTSFTDSHIEFGADAGEMATVHSNFLPGAGQSSYRAIHFNGPDTTAMHRGLTNVQAPLGIFDLDGANNTTILGGTGEVQLDANCQLTRIFGVSTKITTVYGNTTIVLGCRVSASVTIDSTATGSWIGNTQTAGTFTNNSVNVFALQTDIASGDGQTFVGRQKLFAQPSAQERIITSRLNSIGDSSPTLQVGSNSPVTLFSTALTAARAITLSTTGAINGDRFRIVRTAGNTGGPWALSVGGLKSLAQNEWCDVEYAGSATWVLTAFGTL